MINSDGLTLDQAVLMSATDDWVYASEVLGETYDMPAASAMDRADRRDLSVGVVARLLFAGLVELGDVKSGHGFIKWDTSDAEAMVRITRDWAERADPDVMPGDVFWLRNTERGDEIGNAITEWVNADPATRGPAPSVDPARP